MATTLGRSASGRTETAGGPSERATPPTVRTWSDALKTSSARSILSSAFVGTARTWRGRRGASGGAVGPRARRAAGLSKWSARLGGLLRVRLLVGDLARPLAARAQPVDEAAAALAARAAQRQLVGAGLADPALVLGARRAQLADLPARAAGQERLGPLAAQQRAPADVAGHVLLVRADVARAGHRARLRLDERSRVRT